MFVCKKKKKEKATRVRVLKKKEKKKYTGWLKENQDYACPRYQGNSNETEQH